MKAYWGSGGIDPRGEWSASRPGRFTSEESPWYPLGGHQRRSGRGGVEKNSQPLPGLEPQIIQPVVQRYELSLLPALIWKTFKGFMGQRLVQQRFASVRFERIRITASSDMM